MTILRTRQVNTFCLGCQKPMCMVIAKDNDIYKCTPIRCQKSTTKFQLTLGKRKIRQHQNSLIPSGQRQRKKVMKEINMTIQGTCYNILHKHVLELGILITHKYLMSTILLMIIILLLLWSVSIDCLCLSSFSVHSTHHSVMNHTGFVLVPLYNPMSDTIIFSGLAFIKLKKIDYG